MSDTATATVTVRLFAGAAEAAGADEAVATARTAGELRAELGGLGPDAPRVLAQCALLRAGERLEDSDTLHDGDVVDVLPPFAGG